MSADEPRRTIVSPPLLAASAAWSGNAFVQLTADMGGDSQGGAVRLALLVGNRVYPEPFDLPPAYKNVRDLAGVLERRGFTVTSVLDQNPTQLQDAIQAFAKVAAASPPNATILFYYTGHGMQVDAENLMLGSGVPPDSREDTLLNSSLHLRRDVIEQLPRRAGGLTIAVVDACLIVFSTGAGKPAIAPAVEPSIPSTPPSRKSASSRRFPSSPKTRRCVSSLRCARPARQRRRSSTPPRKQRPARAGRRSLACRYRQAVRVVPAAVLSLEQAGRRRASGA